MDESYTLNRAGINSNLQKNLIVVDDFYENPDYVREFALSQDLVAHPELHKGCRSEDRFFAPHMKEVFEGIVGFKIAEWHRVGGYCNGIFQYCKRGDQLVYHCDQQDWAAAIYLTPNAPYDSGTSFFASKANGQRDANDPTFNHQVVFNDNFLDINRFDKVDEVGNVYNRLVIWNARLIHAASDYFGDSAENGRLFHLFFFDMEK